MGDDAMLCDFGGCGNDVAFFRRYYHEGALMRDEVCLDHVTSEPANEEGEVYVLIPINVTGPRLRARENARWMLAWLDACAEFACPTEAHFRLLAWSHLGLPHEMIDVLVRKIGGGDSALAGPVPRAPTVWDADLLARSRDLLLTDPKLAVQLRAFVAVGVADEDEYMRILCDTLGLTRADAESAVAKVQDEREEKVSDDRITKSVAAMDTTLGKMRSILERLDTYFPTLPGTSLPTETFARLLVTARDPKCSSSTLLSLLARALREWVAFLPMHPNVYEAWLLREAERDWGDAEEGKKAAEKLRRAAAKRVPTETAFRVVLTDCPWMSEEDIGLALASVSAGKDVGKKTPADPLGAERRAWNDREQALLRELRMARETIRTLQAKIDDAKGLTAEQTEQVAAAFWNGLAHAGLTPSEGAGPAWDKVLTQLRDLSARDHVGLSHRVRDAILASQRDKPEQAPEAATNHAHTARTRAKAAALAALQRTRLETCELGAAWDALLETLYAPTPAMPHDLADRTAALLRAVQDADREQVAETLRSHPGAASLRRSPTLLEQVITVVTGRSLVQRVEAGILRQLAPASGAVGESEEAILDRLERHDYAVVVDTLAHLVESERVLRREDDGSYVLPPTNDRVRAAILRACEAKPEPWVSIEDLRALVQVALGVRLSDRAFDFAYMPMWKAGTVCEYRDGLAVFVGLPSRVGKAPAPKAAGEQAPAEEPIAIIEGRILAVVSSAAAPVSYTHLVAARAPGTTQRSLDVALANLVTDGRLLPVPSGQERYYVRPTRRPQGPSDAPAPAPVPPKGPGPNVSPMRVEAAIMERLRLGVHSLASLLPLRPPGATREDLRDALARLVAQGKARIFTRDGVPFYEALPEPSPKAPTPVAEPAPTAPTTPAASLAEGGYVPSRDRSPAGPPREGEEVSVAALANGEFIARVKFTHGDVTQPLTAWLGAGTDLVLTWGSLSIASGVWNPEAATVVEWRLFPGNPLVPEGAMTWDDTVNGAVLRLLAALRQHRPSRRWNEERAKGLLLVEAGRAMAQGSPRQAAAWQKAVTSDEAWQSEAGFIACFQRLGPTDTSLPDALRMIYAP